jgi:hypothetical protein
MGKSRKPLKPKGNKPNIVRNTKRIQKNEQVLSELKKKLSN